jgi:tetratricopeptide (TPR) repeat protein
VATRKRIEQILAAAAEHGYAGVEAHGQLALSTALAWADDPDAAAAAAERAHLLAAERGDDRLALEAAARGSSLAAKRQRDAERVTWNARVDALLDRLDARGTRLHGKVLAELGLGAVNVGQIVEAVELYGQAHQIARAFPEETTTLIVASYRYGIALGATHANEEALPYLEESLGLATALLGPQSIPAGDALAGSCTSLDALGQHREAIDVCRRALDVILRYRAADSVSGVQTRLAQALRNAGDWDEAIAVATKAVLLIDGREAEPTLLRGQAHLFLGSTLHAASRYAEAIVELQRGADLIATSIGRSNATYAEALGVIAMAQLDSGDPVAAEATQRRVVATLEGRATTPYERVTAHADLARILRAQGRPSDALAELETVRGEIAFVSAAQTRGDALLLLAQSIADVDPKRRPEARDLARAAAEAYKEAGGRFLAYAQDADAFVRSEP